MFNAQIMILVLLIPTISIVLAYALFPRRTMNVLCRLIPAWNKRYVICHMVYQAGLSDIYFVVRNDDGLTKVGRYSYELSDKYITLIFNKRAHFILDENNAIPRHFKPDINEEIIFQAAEIQTALNNSVMDYLFSKKKDILIIGLFCLCIISLLAIVYVTYELNGLKVVVTTIAQTQAQNIQVRP